MTQENTNDWHNDELETAQEIVVPLDQEEIRIDKYLMSHLSKMSRNRLQEAIKGGAVLVNDKPVKSNYKIRPQDIIALSITHTNHNPDEVVAEDIPLNIVYEDEHLMIINKPWGLVVHPGVGNYSGTLVNAIMHHLKHQDLPVMPSNSKDRPGLVHRLDKDTSGLMVIAKTEDAMTHLAKQFFDHSIERSYQAVVWAGFDHEKGTLKTNIGRHPTDRIRMHVYDEDGPGKRAVTHYRVIEDFYYVSLIECRLETGRTHQIRVHMSHLGHPVFNDLRYGGNHIRKGTVYTKYKQFVDNCFALCPRQALHAKSLGFVHPATGERVYFESELPGDMTSMLDRWRHYYLNKGKA